MKSIIRARKSTIVSALAAVLFTLATATHAVAGGTRVDAVGGPSQVEFPGFFMIQYKGVNYVGTQTAQCAAVPARSIDTIRFWNSLAQAALLSGKTLTIYFDDCTVNGVTTHYLNDLVLVQ